MDAIRRDEVLEALNEMGEPPASFLRMPPEEQRWRGRMVLMSWIVTRHLALAWSFALTADSSEAGFVDAVDVERLLAEVRAATTT